MNLFKRLQSLYGPFKIRADFFFETMLKRKSYMAIGYFTLITTCGFIAYKQSEKQASVWITKQTQLVSELEVPQFLRSVLFGTYAKFYGVNTQQMIKPFNQYKTFSQFFTRKIKQRPIAKQQNAVLSPCDSRVLSFGQISQDSVFVVKGYSYSLGYLLCGENIAFTQQEIEKMKKKKQNKLYHVVLYLSPGDYHRFHSMCRFEILRTKIIQGGLLPVNEKSLISKQSVYESNSRLILHGCWGWGYMGMVLVGALNVGRIVVRDKSVFERGEEMGYFNLGSTIVLIVEGDEMEWKIGYNERLRYGEVIGVMG